MKKTIESRSIKGPSFHKLMNMKDTTLYHELTSVIDSSFYFEQFSSLPVGENPNMTLKIELMIVIAVIAIIAAIAIPNLLSARKSANQSRAVGNIRTMFTQALQDKYNNERLGPTLRKATEMKDVILYPAEKIKESVKDSRKMMIVSTYQKKPSLFDHQRIVVQKPQSRQAQSGKVYIQGQIDNVQQSQNPKMQNEYKRKIKLLDSQQQSKNKQNPYNNDFWNY